MFSALVPVQSTKGSKHALMKRFSICCKSTYAVCSTGAQLHLLRNYQIKK
jgi:hypothetical protein